MRYEVQVATTPAWDGCRCLYPFESYSRAAEYAAWLARVERGHFVRVHDVAEGSFEYFIGNYPKHVVCNVDFNDPLLPKG